MAALKLFAIFGAICLVSANVSSLYETPHSDDHHSNHSHHDHHHHESHADSSAESGSQVLFGSKTDSTTTSSDGSSTSAFSGTISDSHRIQPDASVQSQLLGSNIGGSAASAAGTGQVLTGASDAERTSDRISTADLFLTTPEVSARRAVIDTGSNEAVNIFQNPSLTSGVTQILIETELNDQKYGDVTLTEEVTYDVFTTLTNVFYNTIPVTLTQFVKTTAVLPTREVTATPVDDRVLVSTAPVTRTDTVTVTDTNTAHQFVTEVSTDVYTVTHRAYDIQQQTVTSTVTETQMFRPTVVSTRILTEYETNTVSHTITNTVVVNAAAFASLTLNPGQQLFPSSGATALPANFIRSQTSQGSAQSGVSGGRIGGQQQHSGAGRTEFTTGLNSRRQSVSGALFGSQQSSSGSAAFGSQQRSSGGVAGIAAEFGSQGQEVRGLSGTIPQSEGTPDVLYKRPYYY